MKFLVTPLVLGAAVLGYLYYPEYRMRTALTGAGLPEPAAACMAERVTDRLSVAQLWRLSSLSVLRDREADNISLAELVDATRGLRDRQVVRVTARAAARCALRLA
jgi:hypothetical protein